MMTESPLKEGFMIKKGHIRHNWKSRWFILYSNRLDYFKSRGDIVPKGSIRLKGCSIISPDPEYVKKDCVFRLIEIFGTEYLVQCADENERESWVEAISRSIRKLESISKSSLKISDRPTINSPPPTEKEDEINNTNDSEMLVVLQNRVTHEDLLSAMQDPEAGITLKTHSAGAEQVKLCFSGEDLVSWLLSWAFVQSREEGRVVARELLEKAYLHPVGPEHEKSVKRTAARLAFCDAAKSLYRFSLLNTRNSLDVDFDLSESSDESEEEGILETLQGTVIKQGFLVKKGQVRHNWKVRKFILYEEPLKLIYYSPTKAEKKGRIKLLQSDIFELDEEDEDASYCGKGTKKVIREHCFVIKTKKKNIKYILQAPSDEEMKEWVKTLQTLVARYSDGFDS